MWWAGKFVIPIVFAVGLLMLANGTLHWNSDQVRCFDKKHWSSTQWYTIMAVNRLELRYHNWNWDCNTKYDPKTEKVNDPNLYINQSPTH